MSDMKSKIEQCKKDIAALEDNLRKLQNEPKVGDMYEHRDDRNVRMVCSIGGVKYFVTVRNDECIFPESFPLGEGYRFSFDEQSIINNTSSWIKL